MDQDPHTSHASPPERPEASGQPELRAQPEPLAGCFRWWHGVFGVLAVLDVLYIATRTSYPGCWEWCDLDKTIGSWLLGLIIVVWGVGYALGLLAREWQRRVTRNDGGAMSNRAKGPDWPERPGGR